MGADLPKPDFASNMRLIGHSDQGGSPAGVQIMVHRGHAYIGTRGVIVMDVSDPRRPRAIDHIAPPKMLYCTDSNAGLYVMEYTG